MTIDSSNKYSNIPIIELLQQIKNHVVDPAKFPKETRKACVQVLFHEGYQQSAMASLLKTSDRTIRRDIVEIRKENSLEASPELTAELLGDMVAMARIAFARLRQSARSAKCTPRDITDAEFLAWTVMKEMVEKLNLVGFLKLGSGLPKTFNVEKDSDEGLTESDKAFKQKCNLMTPMQREILLERMLRWVQTGVEVNLEDIPEDGEQEPPQAKQ